MKRTWIYNATIVNEGLKFAGSVVIEGDTICEVLQGETRPSVCATSKSMLMDVTLFREL